MEHPENVKIARPSKYPLIKCFTPYLFSTFTIYCDNCDIDDSTHPIGRRTPFSSLRRFGPADRMCHTCVAAAKWQGEEVGQGPPNLVI